MLDEFGKLSDELHALTLKNLEAARSALNIITEVDDNESLNKHPWPHLVDYACGILLGTNVKIPHEIAQRIELRLRASSHSNAKRALRRLSAVTREPQKEF